MTKQMTSQHESTVSEGVYLWLGGDREAAPRDRWERMCLTERGQRIYRAIRGEMAFDALRRAVRRAVLAGY